MANLLFNSSFVETFLLSLSVLAFVYYLCWYKTYRLNGIRWGTLEDVLAIGMLLVIVEVLIRYVSLRVRYVVPVSIALLILFYRRTRGLEIFFLDDDRNRLSLACIAGGLLLLALSPLFWRDLREARFFIVLLPFVLMLIYTNFQRTVLLTFSVLLLVSGLLYVTSNGIADWFPPKYIEEPRPTVYESVFAYSDRYLRSDAANGTVPYFIYMRHFNDYCRVCKMGTDKIPYDKFDSMTVVTLSASTATTIPSTFVCSKQDPYGLGWIDSFRFRYFKPIYPWYFSAYQCEKGAE